MEQIISCATIKKKWPSEVGGKFFGSPKGSREREPVMCQAPYPPAHHICNVSRNGACGHIANVWRYGEEKLYQIWVPLNTVDYFKWMNYWISDSACFLLTRRQLIPKRKGEELSFVKWLENEIVLVAHYFDTASVEKQRFLKQLIYKHIPLCVNKKHALSEIQ